MKNSPFPALFLPFAALDVQKQKCVAEGEKEKKRENVMRIFLHPREIWNFAKKYIKRGKGYKWIIFKCAHIKEQFSRINLEIWWLEIVMINQ